MDVAIRREWDYDKRSFFGKDGFATRGIEYG